MDLRQLARGLDAFAALDPTVLPLHQAQLFLEVAERGQCSYQDLEEALNLTNGSVSRCVNALGAVNRHGRPGHALLEAFPDPRQPRRLLVRLSARGHALARALRNL